MNTSSIARLGSTSASTLSTRCFSTTQLFSAGKSRKQKSIPPIKIVQVSKPKPQQTKPSAYGESSTSKKSKHVRSAPEGTLRSLISLHHAAASFMHSPEEAAIGFENTFRYTLEPRFVYYEQWRDNVLQASRQSDHLIKVNDPFADDSGMDVSHTPSRKYSQTFKRHDAYMTGDEGLAYENLSEREKEVKEALFGTWERGGVGMAGSKPGLEGVREYLNAKGVSVSEVAKAWELRNHISAEGQGESSKAMDASR